LSVNGDNLVGVEQRQVQKMRQIDGNETGRQETRWHFSASTSVFVGLGGRIAVHNMFAISIQLVFANA
jgi:hypothetical protein